MEVLTFVPSNVVLLLAGYQIQGWDSIKISENTPTFKQIRGIRGKNTRTRIIDSSATITITTPQTELINEVLDMCLQADRATGNVRLDITLREITGTSFFNTTTGYVLGRPELSYSKGIAMNTWTLSCDDSQMFSGCARSAAVGIVQDGVSRLKDFVSSASDRLDGLLN